MKKFLFLLLPFFLSIHTQSLISQEYLQDKKPQNDQFGTEDAVFVGGSLGFIGGSICGKILAGAQDLEVTPDNLSLVLICAASGAVIGVVVGLGIRYIKTTYEMKRLQKKQPLLMTRNQADKPLFDAPRNNHVAVKQPSITATIDYGSFNSFIKQKSTEKLSLHQPSGQ